MSSVTETARPTKGDITALVRLLRFIGKGPADIFEKGKGTSLVLHVGAGMRDIPKAVVDMAISRGLLQRRANLLSPTSAASPFLKRALVKEHDEIFQAQHRECATASVEIDGTFQSARLNALSSPLQALVRLKDRKGQTYFAADLLAAGERFASDFHRGHLNPRTTASWEPRLARRVKGQKSSAQDLNDIALAARLRFTAAAVAMGPELSGVAIDVCCFEKGLELVERERQWPVRSAKLMLRTALEALARHYAPPQDAAKRTSHHWGTEDFRPNL